MTMKNEMNINMAVAAAINYLALDADETILISCEKNGELVELVLCGEWLTYDCFVDTAGGEVLGVDPVPTIDMDTMEGIPCGKLLEELRSAA